MSRKQNDYAIDARTGVASAPISDRQALVYDRAAGEDRVKPSAGGDFADFAGFANMSAATGQSVGFFTIGQASPVTAVDVLQGDDLTTAANGGVTKTTVAAEKIGSADSNAVAGERVTVQISK